MVKDLHLVVQIQREFAKPTGMSSNSPISTGGLNFIFHIIISPPNHILLKKNTPTIISRPIDGWPVKSVPIIVDYVDVASWSLAGVLIELSEVHWSLAHLQREITKIICHQGTSLLLSTDFTLLLILISRRAKKT